LTDGGGLVLEVMPSGSKTWRFKYHLNGKREKVTIGAYPAFTIKRSDARHLSFRPSPTEPRHHDPGTSRKGALFRVLRIAGS
jgi:hypothetical protein